VRHQRIIGRTRRIEEWPRRPFDAADDDVRKARCPHFLFEFDNGVEIEHAFSPPGVVGTGDSNARSHLPCPRIIEGADSKPVQRDRHPADGRSG
jgi:hypothetical protein